jgi:adenylate cyclase class IV
VPSNVEVKARVHDWPALRGLAEQLSDTAVQVMPQVDTFFFTAKGRLKLRELAPSLAQLVYYERPDHGGPIRSDYHIFETRDPESLKAALTLALGVRGVVRKVRYLYLIGQTRLHLDDVDGLGQFMELEVVLRPQQPESEGQAIAEGLMCRLGIHDADLLQGAYIDMLENQA